MFAGQVGGAIVSVPPPLQSTLGSLQPHRSALRLTLTPMAGSERVECGAGASAERLEHVPAGCWPPITCPQITNCHFNTSTAFPLQTRVLRTTTAEQMASHSAHPPGLGPRRALLALLCCCWAGAALAWRMPFFDFADQDLRQEGEVSAGPGLAGLHVDSLGFSSGAGFCSSSLLGSIP